MRNTAESSQARSLALGRLDGDRWFTEGVCEPSAGIRELVSAIAGAIGWLVDQPVGVDINGIVIRPVGQPV